MAVNGRLSEKLRQVRAMTKEVTDGIEARADAYLARRAQIEARVDSSFSPHEAILDSAEADLRAVEEELRQLGNDPLPGSRSSGG